MLFLTTLARGSGPGSLPIPEIRNSAGRDARRAVSEAPAYHDSEDGACRLPIPAGSCIKSRLVKGVAYYDSATNHIIRRPDHELEDFCTGTKALAVVQQLRGAVFPLETTTAETALSRMASDYLKQEALEGGRYFPVTVNEVTTAHGLPQVSTLLQNEYGKNKQLNYSVLYLQQETGPTLVLIAKEHQLNGAASFYGFVAKFFTDKIVAGCARFLLHDNLTDTELETVLAVIRGIQVRDLAPNPQLAKALTGTWEAGGSANRGSYADARYIFGPDGRFARTAYMPVGLVGHGASEPGDYRVFGNLISLRYDKDEVVSFPVRVQGNVMNLGDQAYARVTR